MVPYYSIWLIGHQFGGIPSFFSHPTASSSAILWAVFMLHPAPDHFSLPSLLPCFASHRFVPSALVYAHQLSPGKQNKIKETAGFKGLLFVVETAFICSSSFFILSVTELWFYSGEQCVQLKVYFSHPLLYLERWKCQWVGLAGKLLKEDQCSK